MTFRGIIVGLALIVLVGVGGLVYRNSIEHPLQPITCPLDTETCPDGSAVSRIGSACTFPACAFPNVSLSEAGVSYAVPSGFTEIAPPNDSGIAAYSFTGTTTASTTNISEIMIRRYAVTASSSALAVTGATAINAASGMPVPPNAFTSTVIGNHRFTVVPIEQFEGVVDTAYYLPYAGALLRFDALDTGVANWTSPNLDTASLSAHSGLLYLLKTLQ